MVSKEEKKIVEMFQFFDKYGLLPFERKRIDLTLSGESLVRLREIKNKSSFVDNLIRNS